MKRKVSVNDRYLSVIKKVQGMNIMHPNEDCSEMAERVVRTIGRGYLVTFFAKTLAGNTATFNLPVGVSEKYYYHTVCVTKFNGVKIVIDLMCVPRVMLYTDYVNKLKSNNLNNIRLYVTKGDVGQKVVYRKEITGELI
jgi:hypothetical protein